MPFAIKYQVSDKCQSEKDRGRWVWVTSGEFGPSAAPETSDPLRYHQDKEGSLLTFDDPAKAVEFAASFRGHPWYYEKGDAYEIIEVFPRMLTVQRGWRLSP